MMCGPIFLCVSDGKVATVLYHFGRLWSYLLLGSAGGFLGTVAFQRLLNSPFKMLPTLVLSGYFILSGIFLISQSSDPLFKNQFHKVIAFILRPTLKIQSSKLRAFGIGLATAFLPCGWLYLFTGASIAIGDSVLSPMLLMIFWVGTLPIFSILSRLKSFVIAPYRRLSNNLAGCMLITLGLVLPLIKLSTASHHLASVLTLGAGNMTELIETSSPSNLFIPMECGTAKKKQ
jgi:sulfite exporter TauE/SafE